MRQKIILAFIWPFYSFLYFFRNLQIRENRLMILVFIAFTSFYLIPYTQGDIQFYEKTMEVFEGLSIGEAGSELLSDIFYMRDGEIEFYIQLNVFITSIFSNDPALSFLLTALVYFFFWNKLVSGLTTIHFQNFTKNNNKAYLLICFVAIYVIFFRAINGRFYLAYWVFLSSIFQVYYKKDQRYLIFLCFTVFIHQAFLFMVLMTGLNFITKRLRKFQVFEYTLYGLIFASLFVSGSGVGMVREGLNSISEILNLGFSDYAKESYVQRQQGRDRAWFLDWRLFILFYSAAVVFIKARFKPKGSLYKPLTNFYYLILLVWLVNSWSISVPSFGDRFRTVLIGLMLLYICVDFIIQKKRMFAWEHYVLSISFVFYIIVSLKIFSYYLSFWSFLPLPYFFELFNVPITIDDLLGFFK